MKRLFTISVVLLIVLSANSHAQYVYKHQHRTAYQMPHEVVRKAKRIRRANDMQWVSTQSHWNGRRVRFVVTMKKGPFLIEYEMNRNGQVLSRSKYRIPTRRGRSERWGRDGRMVHRGKRYVTYEYWQAPSVSYSRYY